MQPAPEPFARFVAEHHTHPVWNPLAWLFPATIPRGEALLLLARLEMRIFFSQFIPRIEHMELASEPERLRASFVHGLKHMPIRFRLGPAA